MSLKFRSFLLVAFFSVINAESSSKLPVNHAQIETNDRTISKPEESLPNLRKVLYPTYAREPYGTDFYANLDVKPSSYGMWGPMFRYNELFDRPMRSHYKFQQQQQQQPALIKERSTANFMAHFMDGNNHLRFVPYYGGLGKGR